MNNLIRDKTFRERASSPQVWKAIQNDVNALIMCLGLTGNHSQFYHSNAQRNIMNAFGQSEMSNNGEALDVILHAADYSEIIGNPAAKDIAYGKFLDSMNIMQIPYNLDQTGILVDTGIDTRLKRRALEQTLPLFFAVTDKDPNANYNQARVERDELARHPEIFAEAYKMALFETAMQALFTKGTYANHSTAPTNVLSRMGTIKDGVLVLSDHQDTITEREAVSRAENLCNLLINNERFELKGTERNPNLPYDIAAIKLALGNAQCVYDSRNTEQGLVYVDLPTPAIDYLSKR
jgi:hypothetical protein